jgi:hypothetical protein
VGYDPARDEKDDKALAFSVPNPTMRIRDIGRLIEGQPAIGGGLGDE